MPDNVLLLGGTDVTLAVAEAVLATGARLRAIIVVGEKFSISYSATEIGNSRSVDLAGWGAQHGVQVLPYRSYNDLLAWFSDDMPDICLVAGWYHMVPRSFRKCFPLGCFGFHASLLPQLRGGAPLNWAILSGLSETGVTLFSLEDGVDDGLVFGQERFSINPRTTIGDLVDASRKACSELTRNLMRGLLAGTATSSVQTGIPSYGLQRIPEDGRIQWNRPAVDIDRLVRAVSRPYPGAFTLLDGEQIRIWATDIAPEYPRIFGAPGQLANIPGAFPGPSLPCVVTGAGILIITDATDHKGANALDKLQKSNHKRLE